MAALATIASVAVIGRNENNPEQGCLERGMVDHVEDRGDSGERAAQTQKRRDQTQMADGRIGQKTFQILLEDGVEGAQHQRHHAGEADDEKPLVSSRKNRPHPCQQEDAGFHHRCGMQICRDGCRCRHRVRQPEMERELGALGQGTQQDQ
jgi:hypothetical protein